MNAFLNWINVPYAAGSLRSKYTKKSKKNKKKRKKLGTTFPFFSQKETEFLYAQKSIFKKIDCFFLKVIIPNKKLR